MSLLPLEQCSKGPVTVLVPICLPFPTGEPKVVKQPEGQVDPLWSPGLVTDDFWQVPQTPEPLPPLSVM